MDIYQLISVVLRKKRFGPPGALHFVVPAPTDTVSVPAEIIAQLSAEQQTFFTGETWDTFALFYAAVSAEDWFNVSTMGTLVKGIAFYDPDDSQYQLNKGLRWFGLPEVELGIDDRYSNTENYTDVENYA